MKTVNRTAVSLAEEFTATELAHKLDAATMRGTVARERLRIAWDALRMIAKGEQDAKRVALDALEEIKTP